MTNIIKGSAMRFSLVLTSVGILLILLSIAFHITMKSIAGTEPSWAEMSVFAVGITGAILGVGYNKTKQKEIETNANEDK
jgi:hypothetical protein